MNNGTIRAILERIESARRILVASHSSPDGDAIASTLALANALREMGREVVAFNADPVPQTLQFLPGAASLVHDLRDVAPFDLGFLLDAGELRRAEAPLKELCATLINIDHHPYSEPFGEINYVDEKASATGALIYRVLKEGGHPISPDVALCVYTAILSDTGSFRYSNADSEAFRIAADMVEQGGINPWDVAGGLYESQDEKRLRLLALALATLQVSACGKFASLTLTDEMMRRTGASHEHTDGFVNYPRSIRGVEVAILFRQIGPDAYKVGFRSKGRVDVGALARQLGGGGHHNAAGAEVQGALEEVRASVFSRLQIGSATD
ncbi:DHH family phosphoesterase [Geoalkalibacter halelectricus]|uniref:Bifunctional oligoribonuclease/PAP phosphatase NrnA n=1 Tax=Geoalkalibacter halelectricus TaxID=2847045 RepID=A0ABY5ZTT6_9BACT|nr:bifunctional oligoribonuclease/PAP phosphatase NrnA [Geoalkalibacter halelectricus]MDO3376681.1 bifunctional oligoribonuclease/PAP phosphatase NrnA [Geoalkalibacter halelectricus]UWZ81367.1 bifunctional oligoribonuclease/PAP phosphatase NrnA [Geoalkalibacter halelectricus]